MPLHDSNRRVLMSYNDVVEFLRCEIMVSILRILVSSIGKCNGPQDSIHKFATVSKAISKTDKPASAREATARRAT